jgi:uncharacterized protein YkwD
MKRIVLLVVLVLTLLSVVAQTSRASHAGENSDVDPAHVGVHWPNANEWAFLGEINDYRVANGRGMLQMSRSLAAAARHHSYYMSRKDDVDHTLGSVSWSQNIDNYGYPTECHIGENVLAGRQSAGGALALWTTSEPHRLNMLDPDLLWAWPV